MQKKAHSWDLHPRGEASERKGRYILADPSTEEQARQAVDGASQCRVLRGEERACRLLGEPLGQIQVLEKQRHSSHKGCRDALLQKTWQRELSTGDCCLTVLSGPRQANTLANSHSTSQLGAGSGPATASETTLPSYAETPSGPGAWPWRSSSGHREGPLELCLENPYAQRAMAGPALGSAHSTPSSAAPSGADGTWMKGETGTERRLRGVAGGVGWGAGSSDGASCICTPQRSLKSAQSLPSSQPQSPNPQSSKCSSPATLCQGLALGLGWVHQRKRASLGVKLLLPTQTAQ